MEKITLAIVEDDALKFIHEVLNDSLTKENPAMVAAITELLKEIKH